MLFFQWPQFLLLTSHTQGILRFWVDSHKGWGVTTVTKPVHWISQCYYTHICFHLLFFLILKHGPYLTMDEVYSHLFQG